MPVSAALAGALSFGLGMSLGANAVLVLRRRRGPGEDIAARSEPGDDRSRSADLSVGETRPA